MDYRRDAYLNAALLSRRRLKVALSNPFHNLEPRSTTLPLALLLHRAHGDLFLGTRHICENRACPQAFTFRVLLPLEAARLEHRAGTNWRLEIHLEGV